MSPCEGQDSVYEVVMASQLCAELARLELTVLACIAEEAKGHLQPKQSKWL